MRRTVGSNARAFAGLLKNSRLHRDLSQSKLAEISGLAHSYISRLESGERVPSRWAVERLVGALGFKEGDLRYDRLMESAGYYADGKDSVFACVELNLINDLFLNSDEKTKVDLRLALRLLADGLENRIVAERLK